MCEFVCTIIAILRHFGGRSSDLERLLLQISITECALLMYMMGEYYSIFIDFFVAGTGNEFRARRGATPPCTDRREIDDTDRH